MNALHYIARCLVLFTKAMAKACAQCELYDGCERRGIIGMNNWIVGIAYFLQLATLSSSIIGIICRWVDICTACFSLILHGCGCKNMADAFEFELRSYKLYILLLLIVWIQWRNPTLKVLTTWTGSFRMMGLQGLDAMRCDGGDDLWVVGRGFLLVTIRQY